MNLKEKKIGVLMGGFSKEREISLRSGAAVSKALRAHGYQATEIDVGRDVAERLGGGKIDAAFIALHGRHGEDGTIQGLLEILGIPYTGSGLLPSAICIDKDLTKRLVLALEIRTPPWKMVLKKDAGTIREPPLRLPVIVKPNQEGSTIGLSIVKREMDLRSALEQAFVHDEKVLVEEFISGTEVTVGILEGKALPVLEIVPKSGFYDYEAKYTKGMTEYIVPARIPEKGQKKLAEASERIFAFLNLSGFARMDFIVDPRGDDYFLEVNTIPGMTETSLIPKAAAAVGISFEELCERILEGASLKVSKP